MKIILTISIIAAALMLIALSACADGGGEARITAGEGGAVVVEYAAARGDLPPASPTPDDVNPLQEIVASDALADRDAEIARLRGENGGLRTRNADLEAALNAERAGRRNAEEDLGRLSAEADGLRRDMEHSAAERTRSADALVYERSAHAQTKTDMAAAHRAELDAAGASHADALAKANEAHQAALAELTVANALIERFIAAQARMQRHVQMRGKTRPGDRLGEAGQGSLDLDYTRACLIGAGQLSNETRGSTINHVAGRCSTLGWGHYMELLEMIAVSPHPHRSYSVKIR